MKSICNATAAAFGLLTALSVASSASAWDVQLNHSGKVLIGLWGSEIYAVVQHDTPSNCAAYRLGEYSNDPYYVVRGTNSREEITVVGFTQTFCNRTMSPIPWSSYIDIYGNGGNDAIYNTVVPDVWIFGGDGNDLIFNSAPGWEIIYGDGGDDSIWGNGNDYLLGNGGSDLFCVHAGTAAYIAGADGVDPGTSNRYCGSASEIHFATQASSCPCSL